MFSICKVLGLILSTIEKEEKEEEEKRRKKRDCIYGKTDPCSKC